MSATKITVQELITRLQECDPDDYVVIPWCDITLADSEGSVDGFNMFKARGYEARTGWYLHRRGFEFEDGHNLVVMGHYYRDKKALKSAERRGLDTDGTN